MNANHKRLSAVLIIFTILTPQLESKDAATATARLRDIFKLDSQLASQLDTFSLQLADLQKQIDQVRNDGQLKPLSQILEIDDENSEENFKHPTDQVVIIKRFNDKWKSIRAALDFKKVAESLHYLDDEFSTRREDMHEAMAGIIRLGETYHIPARNFSEGVIKQFHSRLKFDQPQDLFEMGVAAFDLKKYKFCADYFKLLETKLESNKNAVYETNICHEVKCEHPKHGELLAAAYDYHHFCEYAMGNYAEAVHLAEKALNLMGHDERLERNIELISGYLQHEKSDELKSNETQLPPETELCRMGAFPTSNFSKKLKPKTGGFKIWSKCSFSTNQNPSLMIRPVKTEVLLEKPYIEFWHQFLTDNEVEKLKDLGLPELARSTVAGDKEFVHAEYRVSQSSWFPDSLNAVVATISRRIRDMTNFTMETAEALQIANYGVGGQYESHYDFAVESDEEGIPEAFFVDGNRVATVLMYLSDVELGGTTAFVDIGLNVTPEKGGAVFWYNLERDGSGIMETRHAACPVLIGVKWVANKWIRYNGQQFVYHCPA